MNVPHESATKYLASLPTFRKRLTSRDSTDLSKCLSYAAHLATSTKSNVFIVQGDSYGTRVYILGTKSATDTKRTAGRAHVQDMPVIEVTSDAKAVQLYV
jgi:hypothetical protein